MDILLVALVAFLASGLTLFSGFGLGTILMPAFALLMPVEVGRAALAALVAVVAGRHNVHVYYLSFADWAADESCPVRQPD